jgi:hypothetical protein
VGGIFGVARRASVHGLGECVRIALDSFDCRGPDARAVMTQADLRLAAVPGRERLRLVER